MTRCACPVRVVTLLLCALVGLAVNYLLAVVVIAFFELMVRLML